MRILRVPTARIPIKERFFLKRFEWAITSFGSVCLFMFDLIRQKCNVKSATLVRCSMWWCVTLNIPVAVLSSNEDVAIAGRIDRFFLLSEFITQTYYDQPIDFEMIPVHFLSIMNCKLVILCLFSTISKGKKYCTYVHESRWLGYFLMIFNQPGECKQSDSNYQQYLLIIFSAVDRSKRISGPFMQSSELLRCSKVHSISINATAQPTFHLQHFPPECVISARAQTKQRYSIIKSHWNELNKNNSRKKNASLIQQIITEQRKHESRKQNWILESIFFFQRECMHAYKSGQLCVW